MADPSTIPSALKVTALNNENVIMAVAHHKYPIYGLQYHPESILSEYGHEQLNLFLTEVGLNMHIEFKYRYYENEKDYEDYQLEMDNFQDSKIAYRLDEVGMSFTLQNKNNVTEAMLHFMLLMKQHLF